MPLKGKQVKWWQTKSVKDQWIAKKMSSGLSSECKRFHPEVDRELGQGQQMNGAGVQRMVNLVFMALWNFSGGKFKGMSWSGK